MTNRLIAAIVIFAGLLVAVFLYSKYRVAPQIDFSTLQLTDLNNTPISLQQYKGKVLFLNFFATWCGPCINEMPSLMQAAKSLKNEGFVFICISDEPLNRLRNFSERIDSGLVILRSDKSLKDFQVLTVPTSYLLNADAKVVFKTTGVRNWDDKETQEELKNDLKK